MTSERSLLERATKSAVLISTIGAAILQAAFAGRALWFIPTLAILAALGGFVAARKSPGRAAALLLAIGYITPALMLLSGIGFRYTYLSIWIAAFIGVVAATSESRAVWRYPDRFRFPLVAWALVIAVSWPIVALRVLDWNPALFWTLPPTASDAVYALQSAVWVSHVASVQLLGLLWIDWLFAHFSIENIERFERRVIAPLLVAATAAGVLSVYQGFVDLRFLSLGTWSELGRATGAQADGNASGALTGLWVAIGLWVAVRGRNWTTTVAAASSAALLVAATYASGSRTAALCGLVALGAIVHIAVTEPGRRRKFLALAAIVLVVAAAGWASSSSITGPLRRISEVLPGVSGENIRSAARQLWERQGYGTAGLMMIREQPLQGVGVGVFHLLTPDYVFFALHRTVPSDNAQNWFRHELAELGLLGSVGWIWWSALLIAALLARSATEWRVSSLVARYTLVGFGLASLLGVPSQNLFVSLTVWTFAFWLLLTVGTGTPGQTANRRARWPLLAAVAVAVLFAAATAYAGWRDLRPPFLAKRFNYLYEYGLYESMARPSGSTQTSGHSVTVIPAPTARLKLTVWVEHPDADTRPVQVDVWADRRRILHSHFGRGVPLTRFVDVPGNDQRFVLETRVDRTFASPGTRRSEVGLNVDWEFVKEGP